MNQGEWTGLWLAFFAALPPTLTALAAVIVALRGRRQSVRNSQKIDNLQQSTNVALSEMLIKTDSISKEQVRLAREFKEDVRKE